MAADNFQFQGFHQTQFNSALGLNNRTLIGFNLAKKFKTKEFLYNLTSGIFDENEQYSDLTVKNLIRGNIATSVTTEVSDIDINLTLYYQPALSILNDYRMLGELSLQFPISEQLEFEIESALRYDSDPHLNLLPLDFSTIIGMVYSVSN